MKFINQVNKIVSLEDIIKHKKECIKVLKVDASASGDKKYC